MTIVLLAVGGSIGAIVRYLIGLGIMKHYSPPFPIAMLIVNVTGSFGLGLFFGAYASILADTYNDPLYLLIGIGFFGAFTTFSTFSVEAMELYHNKAWKQLSAYVSLSILGSIVSFTMGLNVLLVN